MSALWGSVLWGVGGGGSVGAISPASLPHGAVGASYLQVLSASGGVAPYTWAVTTGVLPAGLTLSAAGRISGTPTAGAVSQAFTVTATDSTATPASINYTLIISFVSLPPPSKYGLRFTNTSKMGVIWS